MNENGTKEITMADLTLKQDAYPAGGSFPADGGFIYSGEWYEALAEDEDGNQYMVRWTRVNWAEEDQSYACDWNNPDYIQSLD